MPQDPITETIQIHEHAIARLQDRVEELHAQDQRKIDHNKREIQYVKFALFAIGVVVAIALTSIKYESGSLSYIFSSENTRSLVEIAIGLSALYGGGAYLIKREEKEG